MSRKQVSSYAVFTNINGSTDINVYYTLGGADTLFAVPKPEADYIIDLLRNEKPIDYDAATKRFLTGFEATGEAEGGVPVPVFTLEYWLSKRIAIRNAINWERTDGSISNYTSWTAAEKTALADMYHKILTNTSPGLAAAPSMVSTPAPAESASTRLSATDAWKYYTAYVAQSLVMEGDVRLNWSIAGNASEELNLLFDSRNLFKWTSTFNAYTIPSALGHCTPGDPYRIYAFLKDNNLIGNTKQDSLIRILGWCRGMIHYSGGLDAANVFNQWQYYGMPPAEYILAGTKLADQPASPVKHRTAGCWGTVGLLRILLRTINVAAKLEQRGSPSATHALPHFFTGVSYYMSHGDDPYNAFISTGPSIPNDKLLIDQAKFTSWFEPAAGDHLSNIGRNPIELAVVYLPNYLLRKYCEDKAGNKTHANGAVLSNLKTVFTLADLEAMNLWAKMDTKITAMGGCAMVPL